MQAAAVLQQLLETTWGDALQCSTRSNQDACGAADTSATWWRMREGHAGLLSRSSCRNELMKFML
jgi:hypothetical protein